MAQSVQVTFGSCIDFDLVFKDPEGQAEDISGDRFAVFDFYPGILADAVLVKADPTAGILHFHLPAEAASQLLPVDVNRLRILRTFADGCQESTERFGITVR
ncbi:hypothetical protein JYU29_05610 [Tianweitania sp. BSSL-BM11]|uniref:Uncharacterized protein n=1 Tax=Tianweitania aestuarii TaxID=2814886 RepID=A0ABS5RWV5_9HYPH|nr:hypothetical protein [Tianweitania aestuarii]MBS9720162.1 hypothetical protein [Tianweitania aestuarii]